MVFWAKFCTHTTMHEHSIQQPCSIVAYGDWDSAEFACFAGKGPRQRLQSGFSATRHVRPLVLHLMLITVSRWSWHLESYIGVIATVMFGDFCSSSFILDFCRDVCLRFFALGLRFEPAKTRSLLLATFSNGAHIWGLPCISSPVPLHSLVLWFPQSFHSSGKRPLEGALTISTLLKSWKKHGSLDTFCSGFVAEHVRSRKSSQYFRTSS